MNVLYNVEKLIYVFVSDALRETLKLQGGEYGFFRQVLSQQLQSKAKNASRRCIKKKERTQWTTLLVSFFLGGRRD